ncbi:uncharacterized protein IL334_002823 [Kwoniella shivajii]|uniref:Protein CPL1-like domain-containing protein n=1 Tax=Kwoniella shivajii TaxID=564305 RepID=A0ABZ1CVT7_9TREE|nr:hypothetical protein IL334_002823 [Kwoniella shivajii]
MKFSSTAAFVTLASLASQVFAKEATRSVGFTPNNGLYRLEARQDVGISICQTIPISVPLDVVLCTDPDGNNVDVVPGLDLTDLTCAVTGGTIDVDLSDGLCLCLVGGVLTDDSLVQLQALIGTGGSNIELLLDTVGGLTGFTVDSLLDFLVGDATGLLQVSNTDCVYPEGAVPNSCDACTFDCPEGEQVCGNTCIAEGDACQSNAPVAKRNLLNEKTSKFLCAQGQTACALPSSRFFKYGGYECTDTLNDVESCGGCTFAFPGQAQGQDCTALPYAIDVACNSGACAVQACQEGYEPNFDETSCVALGSSLGFNVEGRSLVDLDLEPVTELVGLDINDIDVKLAGEDLVTVE